MYHWYGLLWFRYHNTHTYIYIYAFHIYTYVYMTLCIGSNCLSMGQNMKCCMILYNYTYQYVHSHQRDRRSLYPPITSKAHNHIYHTMTIRAVSIRRDTDRLRNGRGSKWISNRVSLSLTDITRLVDRDYKNCFKNLNKIKLRLQITTKIICIYWTQWLAFHELHFQLHLHQILLRLCFNFTFTCSYGFC